MAIVPGVSSYLLTPRARADIFEIWRHIADDDIVAADRVEAAIYNECTSIAEAPFRGHLRQTLTSRDLRFWPTRDLAITHWFAAGQPNLFK